MAADRPYSRVYHEILTDPKFANVYRDDAALAAWLRLLIGAEQAWPMPAAIPRSVDQLVLNTLVDAGLVTYAENGELYRIKGLDAERAKRVEWASAAGKASALARSVQRPSNGRSTVVQRPSNAKSTPSQLVPVPVPEQEGTYVLNEETRAPAVKGWEDYTAPEWAPFQKAWSDRGFRLPPTGRRDDTTPSQRKILWEIAQDRPGSLGKWVSAAPKGSTSHMVVGYVIDQWRKVQADAK